MHDSNFLKNTHFCGSLKLLALSPNWVLGSSFLTSREPIYLHFFSVSCSIRSLILFFFSSLSIALETSIQVLLKCNEEPIAPLQLDFPEHVS